MLSELAALVAFAFVGSFSPGPNNAVLWASGISFGFRRTIPHVIGGALGVGTLVIGVAAGIGAFLEAVPAAATALRVAGSVYLLYVAFQVVGSGALSKAEAAHPLSWWQAAWFHVQVDQGADVPRRPHGRRQALARYALLTTGGPTSTQMEFLSTSTAIALAPPST